jgi:hypothetical protein
LTRSRDVATQGGLVLISSSTIGSAVSSVVVSNCFSATYDNYLVTYNNGIGSQQGTIRIKFNNSSGSTYNHNGYFQTYASGTMSSDVAVNETTGYIGMYNTVFANFEAVIYSPYLNTKTALTGRHVTNNEAALYNTYDSGTASNTGFTLTPSAGTLTGGTISVYGYKK